MSLIKASKSLGVTFTVQIKDGSGNVITPGANDKVRLLIGYEGRLGANNANAKLALTSGTDSSAGSSITKGASNTIRLDATDLGFDAGIYTAFIQYFDNADAQEWKDVDRQVFVLLP